MNLGSNGWMTLQRVLRQGLFPGRDRAGTANPLYDRVETQYGTVVGRLLSGEYKQPEHVQRSLEALSAELLRLSME